MFDVLVYRFLRLWRVMVLGSAFPVSVLWVAALATGTAPYALTALAVLLPVVHVLRYPNVWTETLAFSLALGVVLAMAAFLGWELDALALVWRIAWMSCLFIVVFLVIVAPLTTFLCSGPCFPVNASATATSRLDAETLRKTIVLAPGLQTDQIVCGEADDEGRFKVSTVVGELQNCRYEIESPDTQPDADSLLRDLGMEIDSPARAQDDNDLIPEDGILRHDYYAMVYSSGPDHHVVFTFGEVEPDGATDVVTVRHDFQPLAGGGTKVSIAESGGELTWGDAFGFWLAQVLEDHLTDQIDAAEGRPPRSNRAGLTRQFVIELSNVILPLLGGRRVPPPAK